MLINCTPTYNQKAAHEKDWYYLKKLNYEFKLATCLDHIEKNEKKDAK